MTIRQYPHTAGRIMSSEFLDTAKYPIPDFQRPLEEGHAATIANAMRYNYHAGGIVQFFSHIVLTTTDCVTYKIIDGQHRRVALEILHREGITFPVDISIFQVPTEDEVYHIYQIINTIERATIRLGRIGAIVRRNFTNIIYRDCKVFIRQTSNPRVPNFRSDAFQNHLDTYGVFTRLRYDDAELVTEIINYNQMIVRLAESAYPDWGLSPEVVNRCDKLITLNAHIIRPLIFTFPDHEYFAMIIAKYETGMSYENMNIRTYERCKKKKPERHLITRLEQLPHICFICGAPLVCADYGQINPAAPSSADNWAKLCKTCYIGSFGQNLMAWKTLRSGRALNN